MERPVSDADIREVERFLFSVLESHPSVSPADLIAIAEKSNRRLSPNAITWAIWYLVAEGKIAVTDDYLVTAV